MGLNYKGKVLKILFSLCSYLLITGFAWSQEVVASETQVTARAAEAEILLAQDAPENGAVLTLEGGNSASGSEKQQVLDRTMHI